jgi:hypothetical protein
VKIRLQSFRVSKFQRGTNEEPSGNWTLKP